MNLPKWTKVLFFLLALGFLQLVVAQLSAQNGGIVNQVKRSIS